MMKISEFAFTEYYHQYITIEADDLTENLKDMIRVTEDDCYALCSSYLAQDGLLMFNVLSIGSSWERCTKGLRKNAMLGYFSIEEVCEKEARIVDPDARMIEKNKPFLEQMDEMFDDDLLKTRSDARLDSLRDLFYPDIVLAGIVSDSTLMEYDMCITGVKGPFLAGTLEQEPETDIGIHLDAPMYALPYVYDGNCRLFVLFAGEDLSEDEQNAMNKIITEMDKAGFDFNGLSIKN